MVSKIIVKADANGEDEHEEVVVLLPTFRYGHIVLFPPGFIVSVLFICTKATVSQCSVVQMITVHYIEEIWFMVQSSFVTRDRPVSH